MTRTSARHGWSRSLGWLVLVAALLACAPAATAGEAAAGADGSAVGEAQTSGRRAAGKQKKKKKKNGAKRKAGSCTTARRGRRGRGKARRSDAGAQASAKRRGGKGGKRGGKRGAGGKRCGTRRAAPQGGSRGEQRRGRGRDENGRPLSPRERREQRREEKGGGPRGPGGDRQRPTAPAEVIPDDGSYSAASVPGLSLSISAGGRRGRLVYTLPASSFSEALCQTSELAVDIPLDFSRSNDGVRSGTVGDQQLPGGVASALGWVARDGSFGINVSGSRPYAADPSATCSANARLEGTLVRAAASARASVVAQAAAAPRAEVENCRRLKGSLQRSCRARNAANKLVLKKLIDTRLVGTRGDGAEVDWSFCRSGLWLSAITSDGSTGLSRDDNWQVEDAVVRQGGKWFDAIVTANRGSSTVAVGMRGGRWKVGVSFGDPASSYGPAERTSAGETCAAR